jgi:hypothetical protein
VFENMKMCNAVLAASSILVVLTMLSAGQDASTYGTKVEAGDPDVGLPLSSFSAVAVSGAATPQSLAFISYWDIGSTPGIYDDKDPVYLQFGSVPFGANRIVREGNIRLTGWGSNAAGSKVRAGDSDIGQQVVPWFPQVVSLASGFYFLNAVAGPGYDLGDPVYLHLTPSGLTTTTNDVRITPFAGFPAGSKVSLADSDAAKPLTPLKLIAPPIINGLNGGPMPASTILQVSGLMFFNANGNYAGGLPIYDADDPVYLHAGTANPPVVSPNDVRLS